MNFLPTDYESPKSPSAYMKLEDGDNKFRILSAPIIGWEDWKDKKPLRYRVNNKPETSIDPDKPLRHFWAFIVWNYRTSKIEIYQITQRSIQKRIEALSKDQDWGAPYKYDIKVKKTGQNVNTEYEINPSPHRELELAIMTEFRERPVDLEELFRGGDPFATSGDHRTKGFWEMEQAVEIPTVTSISKEQAKEIESRINSIDRDDPIWRKNALAAFKIDSFEQLEKKFYDSFLKKIEEKKLSLLAEECPF